MIVPERVAWSGWQEFVASLNGIVHRNTYVPGLTVVPENEPAAASIANEWSPPRGLLIVSVTVSPTLTMITFGAQRTYSPMTFSVSAAGVSISTAHWHVLFQPVTISPSSIVTVYATDRGATPLGLANDRPRPAIERTRATAANASAIRDHFCSEAFDDASMGSPHGPGWYKPTRRFPRLAPRPGNGPPCSSRTVGFSRLCWGPSPTNKARRSLRRPRSSRAP